MKGVSVLKEVSPGVPAGPHLTCVRAFVDNDKWLKDSFLASGLVRLGYHPEPLVVTGDCVKAVINVTGTKGCGFKHECTYRFSPDGSLTLENTVTPYGVMPKALPRLGLTMRLDPALEHIKYYGRGPWENYIDRCTGSFVGLYESTVTEQYVDYVRPQDNGYKSGVRWAEFTDGAGRGVRFEASEPLFMQALHFGWEDLFLARHDGWQKHTLQIRRYAPPVAQRDVILNLDVRQTGLGGASVGPAPMEKYRFDPSAPVSWKLRIAPL
jgi:beta-galactosidase